DQRCFPLPGNALPGPCRNSRRQRCSTFGLTSNPRATSPMETPCSSRRTAASLNSLVNILLDNPMTQFSFGWILSLNWLSQLWGPVHGVDYVRKLKRRQGRLGDHWHVDEVFLRINGQLQYLWRAIDQDGDVIDILVQPRRDRRAAERFFRRLLRGQGREPLHIITDRLR